MATYTCPNGTPITWTEIVDEPCSPRIKFEVDRTTAVRVIDVPWTSYFEMAKGILGTSFVGTGPPVAAGPGGPGNAAGYQYVQRFIPWAFPLVTNAGSHAAKKFLYACSVDIEGRGVPSGQVQIDAGVSGNDSVAVYNKARLTVQFDTRMYDIIDDASFIGRTSGDVDEARLIRYVTKIYRPQGEFLTLEGGAYYYDGLTGANGQAVPLSKGVNKIILSYNLSLTWHFIPEEAVPSAFINAGKPNLAIDNCLGRVNNATFSGCRQGTLLLMGAEIKPQITPFGERTYDITYMFKFLNPQKKPIDTPARLVPGHQHIFRPFGNTGIPFGDPGGRTDGWYEVVNDKVMALAAVSNFAAQADSINIYDWADFKTLFRPASWTV